MTKYYHHTPKNPDAHCCICGKKIIRGNYCIAHHREHCRANWLISKDRYIKLSKTLKREIQTLQIAPALGWEIDPEKARAKIEKIKAKLAEIEQKNPRVKDLKEYQEREGK